MGAGVGSFSVSNESARATPIFALIIFTSAFELMEARSTLFELSFLESRSERASSDTINDEDPLRSFSDSDELESESDEDEPEFDEEDEFDEVDEDALLLLLLRRRLASESRLDLIVRSLTSLLLRAKGTTGRF